MTPDDMLAGAMADKRAALTHHIAEAYAHALEHAKGCLDSIDQIDAIEGEENSTRDAVRTYITAQANAWATQTELVVTILKALNDAEEL